MAAFAYKALSTGGQVIDGEIAADSREMALERLREKGLVPLRVDLHETGARNASLPFSLSRRRKVGAKDLMLFTRNLGILLNAGVPLARALTTLERIMDDGPMRGLPGRIVEEIKRGASLEAAMQQRPEVFPPFYTGMIRAGEVGGSLVQMLERLADVLERNEALGSSVRSALIYPLLVVALTGLSLVILMVFVIPEFRPIFEDAGGEMPATTRVILAISDLLRDKGALILVGALASALAFRRFSQSRTGRRVINRWLLDAPLLGPVVCRIETARFCRSLGALRANGVTLIEAISIAAGTLTNLAVADAARRLAAPVSKGEGLSGPMQQTGIFPPLATQLIEVGEASGRLEGMLFEVADLYDREAARAIQRLLALLTPAITIFLGLVIALILGSILSAILGTYELAV